MNALKASIIIPAYNVGKTISGTLNALQNQSIPANQFEVIVVDDGSIDNTNEIVKSFNNVRLIEQKNAGPAIARNNGAMNAKAEIIVFLDSDCLPEKDWLEKMLEPFADERVVAVQGAYKTKQKELIARFSQLEIEYRYKRMLSSKHLDWIATYSAAYRKNVFLSKKFSSNFKSASGEDPELSYSLQKAGYKLVFQPEAIVYHLHPKSLTDYLKKKFNHAKWRVLLYKMHSDKAIKDSYTPQALKLQIIALLCTFTLILLSVAFKEMMFFALLAFIFLLILMLPFVFFVASRDFFIGLLSPIILLLRDAAFLFGLTVGFILLFKGFQ